MIEAMGGPQKAGEVALLTDSAYEGDETRELAQQLSFVPVVPPNPKRKQPWTVDKELFIGVATRSSGCFAGSRPGGVCSRAMTRTT